MNAERVCKSHPLRKMETFHSFLQFAGWFHAHLHITSSLVLSGNEVGVKEWSLKSVQSLERTSSKVLRLESRGGELESLSVLSRRGGEGQ